MQMTKLSNLVHLILLFIFLSFSSNQATEWWQREFGIGVIKYNDMSTYRTVDTVFTESNVHSKIKAVLNGRNLTFLNGKKVSSFKRMIEYDYEIPGWAILSFNKDSSWANVTLDPYNLIDPQTGWINLKKENNSFILWSNLLPLKRLFFLDKNKMEFFKTPDSKKMVSVQFTQFKNSGEVDYIMKPLERKGNWVKVELYTPSPFCKSEDLDVKPKILWIKFLKNNQRPNVFFYTRGC